MDSEEETREEWQRRQAMEFAVRIYLVDQSSNIIDSATQINEFLKG